ncbi:MAG: hypothetical protein JNK72_03090 [Myxococcales bacterium]|nr:hypothetical protein [Myxococcales bacterium]
MKPLRRTATWLLPLVVLGITACDDSTPNNGTPDVPTVEDTGNVEDTGTPPTDNGNPTDTGNVEDSGTPPTDTGNVEDTGTPPTDTGNTDDAGQDGGSECLTGQVTCSGMCVDPQTNSANCGACGNACGTGQSCEMGRCVCPMGQSACGQSCVDVQTNSANCGTCGNACGMNQMCSAGMCVASCSSPRTLCGSGMSAMCVDTQSDANNCGSCGTVCPTGQVCTNGVCGCSMGRLSCSGTCVDGQTDNMNCGACGTVCPTGQTCAAGRCACAMGQTACGSRCVNTQTDNMNCGACEAPCGMGTTCTNGVCACPMGQTSCGTGMTAACVNLDSSNTNCGTCGNACPTGQTCQTGRCACPSGQTACGNACVNTNTSNANCGACGRACGTGQTCTNGTCTCASGQLLCGNACVNPRTDNNNCGMCGRLCTGGQACVDGACACPSGRTLCNGQCVNAQTDNGNCGMCGRACTGGQTCTAGACACATGQIACNNVCTNPQTDNNNCGMCGRICTGGASCVAGVCTGGAPPNDRRTGAVVISLTNPSSTFTVNTTNAANDTAAATSCGPCGAGRDVFYRFTLTAPEIVFADTIGSGFNTELFFQDTNGVNITSTTLPGGLTCNDDNGFGCNTSQASMIAALLQPGTYYIVLGGCNQGAATLHFQHFPVGGNVRQIALTAGASGSVTTALVANRASAITGACCSTGPEDTFYGITCPNSGALAFTASTCGSTLTNTTLDQRSAVRAPAAVCNDSGTGQGCGIQGAVTSTIPGGAGLHVLYVDSCTPIGNPGGAYTLNYAVGTCGAGTTLCNGRCAPTATDSANCGACGNVCGGGTSCVNGACACPTGTSNCGGTCAVVTNDVNNCGACGRRCGYTQGCVNGTCTAALSGPSFRVETLSATGCAVSETASLIGDQRGGVAVNGTYVFTTGDSATIRGLATAPATLQASTGQRHDAMVTNLRTNDVYVLASSAGELNYVSGTQTVTRLLLLSATGALTSTAIALSAPISINTSSSLNGLYSGYDRLVIYNGTQMFHIALPSGEVTNLGNFTMPARRGCETFANFGTAEFVNGALSVVYVATSQAINRVTVPGGAVSTVATFTNLGDMCSVVVSPTTNRWYAEFEGVNQVRTTGASETTMACPATTSFSGDAFRVTALSTLSCTALEHVSVTGDDRGGLAVSSTHTFYNGDSATGRFSNNLLSGGAASATRLFAFASDLRTGRVFAFGAGTTINTTGSGVVNSLIEVDGATGASVGRAIPLSQSINLTGEVGYFSGFGRIVLTNNGRVLDIALPTGTVVDVRALAMPTHSTCETNGFWGVAEYFNNSLQLVYVQNSTSVARLNVTAGTAATLASYTNLSDMCSIGFSTRFNRWYFHYEGVAQFRDSPAGGFADETIGYCAAAFNNTP